jgi:hypothetical protein
VLGDAEHLEAGRAEPARSTTVNHRGASLISDRRTVTRFVGLPLSQVDPHPTGRPSFTAEGPFDSDANHSGFGRDQAL